MLRIIVVGTGSIGMRHVAVLREMPQVEVFAVPTRGGRAGELRADGMPAFDDLPAALATSPRAAIIATDSGRHVQDAMSCLEAGCDVLVEKPMATTLDGGAALRDRARDLGRSVSVACCLRFDLGLAWTKTRLAELGRLVLADFECVSWLPDWRPGRDYRAGYAARVGEGGVLLDLIHEIDAAAWLFGAARTVQATLATRGILQLPSGVEDTALLHTTHGAGLPVTTRLSYAGRPTSRRLRVWGQGGLLEWDAIARRARHVDVAGVEVASLDMGDAGAMYPTQARAWLERLQGREAGPLATVEDGLTALATCQAARDSSGTSIKVLET